MNRLFIISPSGTQAVAAHRECSLSCPHCKGLFLKGMAEKPDNRYSSFLVSGGCDMLGKVPLDKQMLKRLKQDKKKLNIHACNVDDDCAEALGKLADVVSFDFMDDNERIRSYALLRKHCRIIVPHVVIGLGDSVGTLAKLKSLGSDNVVLLVLISRFPGIIEPDLFEIEDALKFARRNFSFVSLGCMRPVGRKKEIDSIAVKYVDSIVNPWKGLDLSGYDVKHFKGCCAFCVAGLISISGHKS